MVRCFHENANAIWMRDFQRAFCRFPSLLWLRRTLWCWRWLRRQSRAPSWLMRIYWCWSWGDRGCGRLWRRRLLFYGSGCRFHGWNFRWRWLNRGNNLDSTAFWRVSLRSLHRWRRDRIFLICRHGTRLLWFLKRAAFPVFCGQSERNGFE